MNTMILGVGALILCIVLMFVGNSIGDRSLKYGLMLFLSGVFGYILTISILLNKL